MNSVLQEALGAGLGGAVTLLIVFIVNQRGRIGRIPKRVDRLEDVVPSMARGIFALLEYHIYGNTNGSKESMKASFAELRDLTTDKMVSQKDHK